MPIKEKGTFFNVRVTAADGKVADHLYRSQQEAMRIRAKAEKQKLRFDVTKAQTFVVTTAESLEDITNVVRDPAVALSLFNYGCKLYQQARRARHMKDPNWEGVEEDIELIDEIQDVKAERRTRFSRKGDEFAAARRGFKTTFAKKYPNHEMPSDDEINKLLSEIFDRQAAPEPEAMSA